MQQIAELSTRPQNIETLQGRVKLLVGYLCFTKDITVIHQNKTPTPISNSLEKGSYFDVMLFVGEFSGPSRLRISIERSTITKL